MSQDSSHTSADPTEACPQNPQPIPQGIEHLVLVSTAPASRRIWWNHPAVHTISEPQRIIHHNIAEIVPSIAFFAAKQIFCYSNLQTLCSRSVKFTVVEAKSPFCRSELFRRYSQVVRHLPYENFRSGTILVILNPWSNFGGPWVILSLSFSIICDECMQDKSLNYLIWESHIWRAYLVIQGGKRIHAMSFTRIKTCTDYRSHDSHHLVTASSLGKLPRRLLRVVVKELLLQKNDSRWFEFTVQSKFLETLWISGVTTILQPTRICQSGSNGCFADTPWHKRSKPSQVPKICQSYLVRVEPHTYRQCSEKIPSVIQKL